MHFVQCSTAKFGAVLTTVFLLSAQGAFARTTCKDLPTHAQLSKALVKVSADGNGGIFTPNMMWAVLVARDGTVCAVAKTGDAWPGSRVIAAQKANTANAFSNEKLSLSTANLYSAVQPGGSLFGLQESNPVDSTKVYQGSVDRFGTAQDPLVGQRSGGVNVFGGGVALYKKTAAVKTSDKGSAEGFAVVGALGVSGDSSCADHIIAWRIRQELGFKEIPGGVSGKGDDNIVHDIDATGKSAKGFGHPSCGDKPAEIAGKLVL